MPSCRTLALVVGLLVVLSLPVIHPAPRPTERASGWAGRDQATRADLNISGTSKDLATSGGYDAVAVSNGGTLTIKGGATVTCTSLSATDSSVLIVEAGATLKVEGAGGTAAANLSCREVRVLGTLSVSPPFGQSGASASLLIDATSVTVGVGAKIECVGDYGRPGSQATQVDAGDGGHATLVVLSGAPLILDGASIEARGGPGGAGGAQGTGTRAGTGGEGGDALVRIGAPSGTLSASSVKAVAGAGGSGGIPLADGGQGGDARVELRFAGGELTWTDGVLWSTGGKGGQNAGASALLATTAHGGKSDVLIESDGGVLSNCSVQLSILDSPDGIVTYLGTGSKPLLRLVECPMEGNAPTGWTSGSTGTIEKWYRLSIVVRDQASEAVAGATVSVRDGTGALVNESPTDDQGRTSFLLKGRTFKPGDPGTVQDYSVQASFSDAKSPARSINAEDSTEQLLTLSLMTLSLTSPIAGAPVAGVVFVNGTALNPNGAIAYVRLNATYGGEDHELEVEDLSGGSWTRWAARFNVSGSTGQVVIRATVANLHPSPYEVTSVQNHLIDPSLLPTIGMEVRAEPPNAAKARVSGLGVNFTETDRVSLRLVASGTDPRSKTLRFLWNVGGESLEGEEVVRTFGPVSTGQTERFIVGLIGYNSDGFGTEAFFELTIHKDTNLPPRAVLSLVWTDPSGRTCEGTSISVRTSTEREEEGRATVILDASGSSDPDGDEIVEYRWTVDGKTLSGRVTNYTFDVTEDRRFEVTLVVTDGDPENPLSSSLVTGTVDVTYVPVEGGGSSSSDPPPRAVYFASYAFLLLMSVFGVVIVPLWGKASDRRAIRRGEGIEAAVRQRISSLDESRFKASDREKAAAVATSTAPASGPVFGTSLREADRAGVVDHTALAEPAAQTEPGVYEAGLSPVYAAETSSPEPGYDYASERRAPAFFKERTYDVPEPEPIPGYAGIERQSDPGYSAIEPQPAPGYDAQRGGLPPPAARRAGPKEIPCPYCGGPVEKGWLRCPHCTMELV